MCKPFKSAVDKNFNENATSSNPKTTLMLFNHPPDFGRELSRFGISAKRANGRANATENPLMPITNPQCFPEKPASARMPPRNGPVQENEIRQSVRAIKK